MILKHQYMKIRLNHYSTRWTVKLEKMAKISQQAGVFVDQYNNYT